MRVYYLTSHKIAVEHILAERRMKLSLFDELNDPFELQPYSLTDKDLRRVNRFLQEAYFGKKGLMCFSDNWASPVMWAHYADKHHGVCLGFDIPDRELESLLFKVTYNASRLQFALDHAKDLMGIDQAFIQTLVSTKSHEWSYEREYRAIANLEVRDPTTGFYYVDFGPELRLREVILGSRNQTPVGQVAKMVKGNSDSVLVYKARPAFQKFEMVRNKSVSAITVKPRT